MNRQNLNIKLKQKLQINQRQNQSLKILSLSGAEILDLLKEEAETNPLLDIEDIDMISLSYRNYVNMTYFPKSDMSASDAIEIFQEEKLSATEKLLREIAFLDFDETEKKIADKIVKNLDKSGFVDRDDLAAFRLEFSVDKSVINRVMAALRTLEPAGIFAYSLVDSLILQLKKSDKPFSSQAIHILKHHKNRLMNMDIKSIAEEMAISNDDVLSAIRLIKSLNPRPLSFLDGDFRAENIVPDLKIMIDKSKILLELRDNFSTSMKFEDKYLSFISNSELDDSARAFLKNELGKLKLIRASVKRRSATIKKIADYMLNWQKDYFIKPGSQLRALSLKDIGRALNMHESTVSRSIRSKYVETPLGIFELRFFLEKSVPHSAGNNLSVSEVKSAIRKLIDEEDRTKPLSDQKIKDALLDMGISISRRAVCKYRLSLSLGSASERKTL